MAAISKSYLMATSAIAGIALMHPVSVAQAQENFGVRNDDTTLLQITIAQGQTVAGNATGVFAANGPVTVNNAGTIRGDGNGAQPNGAVVITVGPSSVANSGTITGATNGVITANFTDPATGQTSGRAIGTVVNNSGALSGLGNDAIRLVGGGTVNNSGTISGSGSPGADGISMFPFDDQAAANYSARVNNTPTGVISGVRGGVFLSGGGDVANAGRITGETTGVFIQGTPVDGTPDQARSGLTANVTNSGTIRATAPGAAGSVGVGFGTNMTTASLENSGQIISDFSDGVSHTSLAGLTINNAAGGRIEGGRIGINSSSFGTLTVNNAGTIRGNGTGDSLDAPPGAGITIATGGSSVTNSGTISGAGLGITTAFFFNPATNSLVAAAVGTSVVNTGTISGESNDGVRLIGGGTVDNAGTITGRGSAFADGISMFPYAEQASADYAASVINRAAGTVAGDRFGVILSAGGEVDNAGSITGGLGGVFIQGTALNVAPGEDRSGQEARVVNSGTIRGTADSGFTGTNGEGVGFAGDLARAELINSGTILSDFNAGVSQASAAQLAITNTASGRIEGATSGVHIVAGATSLDNAGIIRGNGVNLGSNDTLPGGGVVIQDAGTSITNSGTISGAQYGVSTVSRLNSQTGEFEGLAANTVVVNSGTIRGDSNDGVRLIGGGLVENSGTITGTGNPNVADGISMFSFAQPPADDYSARVDNAAGGTITGDRFGIILSNSGDVTNAGSITGGSGGVLLQANTVTVEGGKVMTASLVNTGSISGTRNFGPLANNGFGVSFAGDLVTASVVNSGTITSTFGRGVNHGSTGDLTITNEVGGRIEGATSGIFGGSALAGSLTVNNAGTIRGNGTYDGFDRAPDAGITIFRGGSSVTNSGTISGATSGITTATAFNSQTNSFIGLAVDTVVVNSGTISGENNDGVRLIGGGVVENSGTITGRGNDQADGVSMFPHRDQASEGYSASVTNAASGVIGGDRFGVILSAGGDVDNAGEIGGVVGGVFVQGTALNVAEGEDRSGLTGSVTNTGTISATGNFGFAGLNGYGVGIGGDLASATVTNSGTITSQFHAGVGQVSSGALTVTNAAAGRIEGGTSGVWGFGSGALTVINAGTIRGNGTYDGFDAAPDAGVNITAAGSSVTNSGTISGAASGITTAFIPGPQAGQFIGRAIGTVVTNSGTIRGESNDGVRLIGGGTVTNSGTISGTGNAALADGVSMFRYQDQQLAEGYVAAVTNETGGTITGDRFGVALFGGGTITNNGTITGGQGGTLVQDQTGGGSGVQVASLTNAGTITGSAANGVQFTGALGPVTLANSGTITGATGGAIVATLGAATITNSGAITGQAAQGVLLGLTTTGGSITNDAGASITGQTSGVVIQSGVLSPNASVTLVNAGTIRGNGVAANAQAFFEGGVRLQSGSNAITNSGTISGAQFGITTTQAFNPQTQSVSWRVGPTEVVNTGTIRGETNDAIALFGGGRIVNSGSVIGGSGVGADGIQLQFYPGQNSGLTQIGSIENQAGGTITGERYGIILAGGGTITNAGAISGGTTGVVLVSQNFSDKTGTLDNSGTITGGVLIDLSDAEIINSGTITSAAGTGVQIDGGRTEFVNSGRISGGNGIAIQFAGTDDELTLLTGSAIDGLVDGGDGRDSLTLAGDVLELTAAQQLGATSGFETLDIASGYWSTVGQTGRFDTVAIAAGAALQLNSAGGANTGSPIFAASLTNDGALVLNLASDISVADLAGQPITGAGSLRLIGDGVLVVNDDALRHSGGTTIANGGLLLTGTLVGDVTTAGNGVFQIGTGGDEGAFAGNLVNNGRFVVDRATDFDFTGAFSGTGVLDKLGAGVLIFSGDYDFRGTTNIRAGSVRIGGIIDPTTQFNLSSGGALDISGNNQTIAGLSGAPEAKVELGAQTLTVNQTENTTFQGAIAGTGGLAKEGDGLLNLTGNSTFTGPTTVNGGTLAVNGSIISPVTVNTGGTLGGNGSVGSTTVATGGVVAPGNSIGRLAVNGNLAFGAGAIYEVEVNAAGAADRIDASGQVTIAGTARMAVLAEAGNYRPRTDYTVLTAGQGVTGRFGSVTTDLAFLTPFLRYGTNAVTLSLYRNDVDFAAVAATANQAGVARVVQSLGIDNPLFEAVLVQNAATARATFADLSGELHASTITGLTDDSRHLRNALMGMPAAQEKGLFVWASGFGGWGDFDATAANFGMETNHNGFVTGVGFGGEGFGIALSGGLGGSEFGLTGQADRSNVSSTYLALHGTFGKEGGVRGAAGISYAWHEVATSRVIAAPLAQALASRSDAKTLQVFGELGYEATLGNVALTPFVRLAHVSTDGEDFAETGGGAALAVAGGELNATFLSLGTKVRFGAADARFKPYASLAWNHAMGDRGAATTAQFTTGGGRFGVAGLAIPKSSAEAEAGLEYRAGNLSIGAGYTGVIASGRNAHGARVTLRLSF